ncbi:MAG: PqqD family protein, partial [Anaerolineales bacterium]|nr:PqqD family protein [Anaerolineales bacterium]
MSLFTDLFNRKSSIINLKSGLYHYTRETEHEKSRIHLRVDADGHGTLIVNANSVMHLNPTATFMAWLTLEGKTEDESVRALRSQYSVSKHQAKSDLSSFLFQFEELIRPDGACPV